MGRELSSEGEVLVALVIFYLGFLGISREFIDGFIEVELLEGSF